MATEKKINQSQAPKEKGWRFINYRWVVKNVPFFLFLGLLAILYIYNGHHADKMVSKIAESEKRIRDMEYEYKSLKSEVIFRSKASELKKAVEPIGLKESNGYPVILKDSADR